MLVPPFEALVAYVDADIWRMRGAFQRGYMRTKFDFIFQR
jgi:hypothetical protein